MLKKFSAVLVTLTVLFSGFTGCGPKEDMTGKTKIRVAFWGSVDEKKIIEETVEKWEKGHPSIKVVLQHIPGGTYLDKIMTEIAAGDPPDVIFVEVQIFVSFFAKHALLDLSPYINKDTELKIKEYFPEVMARFTRKGKTFVIPRDTAPFACVFYNKNIFDKNKVPYPKDNWDFNDLIRIGKKLTIDKSGKRPGDEGFNSKKTDIYGYASWSMTNYIYSFGGHQVDNVANPTKCVMNSPQVIKGLEFFRDLAYKHHISPKAETLQNMGTGVDKLFSMERLAMFQSGIWETPTLRRLIGKRFNWDVAMFPKGHTGIRKMGTGGSGYAILKQSKHPDEAWEVVKCLAGEWGQQMLADTGLAQPANKRIAEGPYWAGSTKPPLNKGMLNEAVKYATYDPFHPIWREAWSKYGQPEIDLVMQNKKDPKEAVKIIEDNINRLFKQYAAQQESLK